MMRRPDRRRVCAGLAVLAAGGPAAQALQGLDGTWGGARDGVTAQVIVTGGAVIGFFWRDDYLDARDAKGSADGLSLSFAFDGGSVRLTRTGERTATIEVKDRAGVARLDLAKD
jgi:hypothetical protein